MKLPLKAAHIILWLGTLALAACGGSNIPPTPATADWHTNGLEAKQMALQTNRLLFVAFMGSDWSSPCQTIRKEVLDTQTFKDFADANLVLVMADFSRKNPEPPDLAKQYSDMARGAQLDRLPVFMLVDPHNGTAFSRIANYSGNPEGFINQIQNGLDQYRQSLQPSAPAPSAPALPATLPPPSSPTFSQPAPAAPAGLPGLPSFPSSLPTPDQLMHRSPTSPPQPQ